MADLITMLSAAAGAGGEYEISRSLRFNSADSAYLNRTPASASNRKTWTWSGWVKRSKFSGSFYFFCGNSALNNAGFLGFSFEGNDRIEVTGWTTVWRSTSAQYRDPSAWYHVVVVLDTTQATADNRVRVYVNGEEVTAFVTKNNPTQNDDLGVNTAAVHYISSYDGTNSDFDGYLADINFIDGQALTPSSFGEINPDTGVWQPIKYAGSYGTNGFYLNFSDNSNTTASTLGKDYSGNGNNWTPNNFSVTAGAGNDSLVDTPTPYGTDTGAGGEVRGNYCTLNPLDKSSSTTLSNGNLDVSISAAWNGCRSTIGMSSGKWYWEVQGTTITSHFYIGIATAQQTVWEWGAGGPNPYAWIYISATGQKSNNGTTSAYGATYTDNDVIGVAFDADNGTLTFYKNGVSQGTAFTGLTSGPYFAGVSSAGVVANFNFGQRPFAYTAPSGFKALVTTNLPDPTVVQGDDYFNTVLWTGTGGARTITGVGFQPDFVWGKGRSGSATYPNLLWDSVRGTNLNLVTNNTGAEFNAPSASSNGGLGTSVSDGFTIVAGTSTADNLNALSPASTYVAWNWKANGAGVSNTAGTITSTVSANTTAGISIVTYTGTGSAATVGHGLGAVPRMIIVKNRDATDAWQVYHAANTANPETDYLVLNTTAATADAADRWNDTLPTSTVFSIGNGVEVNTNTEKYVAYCFAEVEGFSKFGSYTGNGSADGPFVYTGFRPAFVMIKRTDSTSNWTILDNKREGYNVDNDPLFPNLSNAEGTTDLADLLSNGFKLRSTDASVNASGGSYIYMAFSEVGFKYALGR